MKSKINTISPTTALKKICNTIYNCSKENKILSCKTNKTDMGIRRQFSPTDLHVHRHRQASPKICKEKDLK